MKKHHIAFLLSTAVLLAESCGGINDYGYEFECLATNVTTLFKDGILIDTLKFYNTQYESYANKHSVTEIIYKEDTLSFSKDSVLNFFHTGEEYSDLRYFDANRKRYIKVNYIVGLCGLIVEHDDHNIAGTFFITPEGYKLLELCDYDSVTMFYTFVIYPE
ncbi:MAG: hypothetical protein J6W13_09350 [Salinivirgaceae bacterium]|nr:hypothetical protein [Salinivirgaceae bacterium]